MSAHMTKDNDDLDVPKLPCPACIEAASKIIKGKELVPEHALRRYTFAQLVTHLESNIHNQKEFVTIAVRASIFLYRQAFAHAYEEIEDAR